MTSQAKFPRGSHAMLTKDFLHKAAAMALAVVVLASIGLESTASTNPTPAIQSGEPICAAPPILLPLPVSPNQPASTRRMVQRLQEILRAANPRQNGFMSAGMAEALRQAMEGAATVRDKLQIKPQYAQQLLQAGQPEAALKEFEELERRAVENFGPMPSRMMLALALSKAMCHFRVGEIENCLYNHSADSCLIPIQGGGIHTRPRGSRAAIEQFTWILRRSTNDLRARWLLNIASMTLGEYPDKVPAQWLIPPRCFESDYDIKRFPDVAGKLGLDVDDIAGGLVIEDFDNDGLLDLMASGWGLRNQLRVFRNNGDGTFTERTAQAKLAGLVSGLNMIHGDYNNDGLSDVLILRGAWLGPAGGHPNSLLRNNGDFTFTDVTEEAGLLSFHPTQTAAWLDYNGDGWLDIFIGNESTRTNVHPCELFRNNGDGTFTECAKENGLAITSFVKGVTAGDFNNDGRPDLYLSLLGEPNMLWRNDGPATGDRSPRAPWRFTEVATAAGVTEPLKSFPCWFWDYDNDGWLDLLVMGYSIQNVGDIAADYLGLPHGAERARLYRNNGDGTFKDVTAAAGIYKLLHAMGSNFGDLDNDGWLDFYLGTGDPDLTTLIPNRMFRNAGGKSFQDVTASGGFGQLQKGHAVAFGDFDNDGDQDVYSVVGGAYSADNYRNQLFANPGHGNRWLKLKLEGATSNRVALGARIKVVVKTDDGERAIHRTVGSGGSFGASSFRQEIGLGQAREIVRVEIFWPTTGRTQTLRGMEMNRFYKIREGEPNATPAALVSFPLPTSPDAPARHHGHAAPAASPASSASTRSLQ